MGIIRIAYLGPEIPATSATFISNEIIEMENEGFEVDVFSVHPPSSPAEDLIERETFSRTCYLYSKKFLFIYSFIRNVISPEMNLHRAFSCLVSDMSECGIFSMQSVKLMFQFFAANYLAMILSKRGVRYLHIHFGHVPTQIGMYGAIISGIPFSFTTHANDIYQQGLLLRRKSERCSKVHNHIGV